MFSVIETGGKQYKVAVGEKIKIEKLKGNTVIVCNHDAMKITGVKKVQKVFFYYTDYPRGVYKYGIRKNDGKKS